MVDSTNEYLKNKLSKSTPFAEGTVIMAVEQAAGRGQKGTVWHSERGKNLTCSVLLNPSFLDPIHQFRLTVAISLALINWLEPLLQHPVKIKWPNDIFVGDRKIAGILIENLLTGKHWKSAIVGIGVNVNQTGFPDPIGQRSCSIKQILHRDSNIPELLSDLCHSLEQEYLALKSGKQESQLARYKQHLYRLDESHSFLIDGIEVNGVLCGVTDKGRLMIDFNGHITDFDIKEVAFVI